MLITPWTQKSYIQWEMVRKEFHFTFVFWILVQNFEIFDPMSAIFINITWTNKMILKVIILDKFLQVHCSSI